MPPSATNLSIPFPIRTLYHYHGPSSQQKRLATQFNQSLQAIPSFVPLNREESGQVTSGSGIALQHFAAGEKVIRQGRLDNELYFIVAGQAMMSVRLDTGAEIEILPLRSGEFFGEMSLFSGEPSAVTIAANQDLEVMKISASVVNRMIDRQPSFAREIGQILEIRRLAIQEATHAHLEPS
jgi:CRP-like cAMP-binding protein